MSCLIEIFICLVEISLALFINITFFFFSATNVSCLLFLKTLLNIKPYLFIFYYFILFSCLAWSRYLFAWLRYLLFHSPILPFSLLTVFWKLCLISNGFKPCQQCYSSSSANNKWNPYSSSIQIINPKSLQWVQGLNW